MGEGGVACWGQMASQMSDPSVVGDQIKAETCRASTKHLPLTVGFRNFDRLILKADGMKEWNQTEILRTC